MPILYNHPRTKRDPTYSIILVTTLSTAWVCGHLLGWDCAFESRRGCDLTFYIFLKLKSWFQLFWLTVIKIYTVNLCCKSCTKFVSIPFFFYLPSFCRLCFSVIVSSPLSFCTVGNPYMIQFIVIITHYPAPTLHNPLSLLRVLTVLIIVLHSMLVYPPK